MGIPSTMRDLLANRRSSLLIASPHEEQQRVLNARKCTEEGVRAGAKAASITCVATAVPTLVAVRVVPWAKANLNYTATIAAYFITVDKTILECARRNAQYEKLAQYVKSD
ncbi:early nodulin-93-like isoform X2 [Diospyros lotus]|uniref:early nodulin-93-like isoform X2 n=1 Tax=Diospyros lotus TaxID=55363 RepID=UPI00224CE31B|nr:early nodulin-93-like isoform X2 [Diospyros lotus]